MSLKNSVLVMEQADGVDRLRLITVDPDAIPELINGEHGFHIYHVRMLTEMILRQLKKNDPSFSLTDEEIVSISIASSLHDIGKLLVPQSILNFPGTLSPVEYDIVKKHSAFGEKMIAEAEAEGIAPEIVGYAREIALRHHERIDGSGYPGGLRGEEIPIYAQAVALADAYDALTSPRSYKQPFPQDIAIQMISSGMCGVFSEMLTDCLMKVVNDRTLIEIRDRFNKTNIVVADHDQALTKRVFCTGNIRYITEEFLDTAFPDTKVVLLGDTHLKSHDNLKVFRGKGTSVDSVFKTYEFDAVVYFSDELTCGTQKKSDSEELREVLKCIRRTKRDIKVLYFSSLDTAYVKRNDRAIVSAAKEQLCEFYAKEHAVDIRVVRIPYLYSGTIKNDFLYGLFEQLYKKGEVSIDKSSMAQMFFLSCTDLAKLIARLFENWRSGGGMLTVNDEFGLTYKDLAESLVILRSDATVEFDESIDTDRLNVNNKALRNQYGWFAQFSILVEIEEEYERFVAMQKESATTLFTRIRNWVERHALLVKCTELALLFALSELFVYLTDSAVLFAIVDFRLSFIVIMATVHGLTIGLGAAGLSSVAWFVAKVLSGTHPLTIFYEPTNWLTFVFYFLVAAVCGYVKLKGEDKLRFMREENRLLEEKLVFTREIYADTFREKRELKKQIIGSKDSFGKIFDITRKLDAADTNILYLKIMDTFEDVLENKSICVYSVNEESTFGRLQVASRDIIGSVSRSISLQTYAPVIDGIADGQIFRNTELIPDLPMYAAGVYRDGKLTTVIFIWLANKDQHSLYYVNLFKILRDLAQMSLLRAYDYSRAIYDKQYLENTGVMNAEAFEECIRNFDNLVSRKIFSYILMEFESGEYTMEQLSSMVSARIRTTDIMGMTRDGKLQLLLSQATPKDLDFILPRFESMGVGITVVQKG